MLFINSSTVLSSLHLDFHNVSMSCSKTVNVMLGMSFSLSVFFEHPIQIEPDTFYTASAILEGTELSYFGQEGVAEVTQGKVS